MFYLKVLHTRLEEAPFLWPSSGCYPDSPCLKIPTVRLHQHGIAYSGSHKRLFLAESSPLPQSYDGHRALQRMSGQESLCKSSRQSIIDVAPTTVQGKRNTIPERPRSEDLHCVSLPSHIFRARTAI